MSNGDFIKTEEQYLCCYQVTTLCLRNDVKHKKHKNAERLRSTLFKEKITDKLIMLYFHTKQSPSRIKRSNKKKHITSMHPARRRQ